MNRITLDEEWRNGNRYILAKAEKNGKLYSCEFSAFDNDYLGAAYVAISNLLKQIGEKKIGFPVICYHSESSSFVVGKEYDSINFRILNECKEFCLLTDKDEETNTLFVAMNDNGKAIAEFVRKL